MKFLNALVVTNQPISTKILNWKLNTVEGIEKAIELVQQQDYKVIAIDSAIPQEDQLKLEAIAKLFNSKTSVANFSTQNELDENIRQAFRTQKQRSLNHKFLDNAFEIELACKLNLN